MMTAALKRGDRAFGVPRWAWLPVVLGIADLLMAAFGFYWDVSWHIEKGRDEFIFTPPHTLIVVGLLGVGLCGLLAHRLRKDDPGAGGIGLRGHHISPGAALLMVCGIFALAGFPLDDVWHRFFGEDVTLWGPTHLLMVSGAALSPLGFAMLLVEGRSARSTRTPRVPIRILGAVVGGAMLTGLSAYQAEFDFGVPQFQLLYQPVLIAVSAAIVLVGARFILGRGGALATVLAYIFTRVLIDVLIAASGRGVARFPLYLVAALSVEVVAYYTARRTVASPVLTGLAIGTAGLLGEALWLRAWGIHPWPAGLLVRGIVLGTVGAIAGAFVGRAIAARMRSDVPVMNPKVVALASAVVVIALVIPLPRTANDPPSARFELSPAAAVEAAGERKVTYARATVTMQPPDAAENADWFELMAWQGGGQVVEPLERTGPGTYETEGRVPLGGEWKLLLRLAEGPAVIATPIYLPADPAIDKGGVYPKPMMTKELELDSKLLLREARGGPSWLLALGYGAVITIVLLWIVAIAVTLSALRRALEGGGATVIRAPRARLGFPGRARG